MNFTKWLSLRKKQLPVPVLGRMSDKESRELMAKKSTEVSSRKELDPDELEASWRDSLTADPRTGITDAQRKAANANNPKFHMSPDELEVLWKSSVSR